MTTRTPPPPPPDDWYDPPARPNERPGPSSTTDRAFLAFLIAGGAVTAGVIAAGVIPAVREHPREVIIGALAVSAVAWVARLVAGVILRIIEGGRTPDHGANYRQRPPGPRPEATPSPGPRRQR